MVPNARKAASTFEPKSNSSLTPGDERTVVNAFSAVVRTVKNV
jgi:hypothetical protein